MCDICKKDVGCEYVIESAKDTIETCPNCTAIAISNHTLNIPEGRYESEVSGERGAVLIHNVLDNGIPYIVTPDEAIRLLGHSLMSNEHKTLTANHTANAFELHDDFYTDDGFAYQPVDGEEYEENLAGYCSAHPEDTEAAAWLASIKELREEDEERRP